MSSKSEDFPTPVSPTRRMLYGAFVLLFDALMIPLLRDSTLLKPNHYMTHQRYCRHSLDGQGVIFVIDCQVFLDWTSRTDDHFGRGHLVTGWIGSGVIRSSGFRGRTNGLGLTLTAVNISWKVVWGDLGEVASEGTDPLPRKFILDLLTNVELVYTGLNMEQNAMAFSLKRAERGQPRRATSQRWPLMAHPR